MVHPSTCWCTREAIQPPDYEETQQEIQKLIFENEDIFWLEGEKLGLCTIEHHEINLTDTIPVYRKQFPLAYRQREDAEIEALKLIKGNLVRPSTSPYNAPVFVIEKKPLNNIKRLRLIIDYSLLNFKTIPDPYMLPTISEIFDEIGKNKYFSAIDISQGFTNIPIKESDIYKTAWWLPNLGRFEYKILLFGLMNAPRTFFRVMSKALEGLIGVICFCFIDDIIIFSKDLKTHLKNYE